MAELPVATRLIRQWCADNGTQEQELAELIGISKGQMSGYMNGHRRPSLLRAFDFESVTKVPAQTWALYEDPEDPIDLDLGRLSKASARFWGSVMASGARSHVAGLTG